VLKLKLKDSPVLQWRDGQIRIRQEYFIPFSRDGLEIIYRTAPDREWPAWLIKDLRLGKSSNESCEKQINGRPAKVR